MPKLKPQIVHLGEAVDDAGKAKSSSPPPGGGLAAAFGDYLGRELQELQGRVLAELEHQYQLSEGKPLSLLRQCSPHDSQCSAADFSSQAQQEPDPAQRLQYDRWEGIVSQLVERSLSGKNDGSMCNLTDMLFSAVQISAIGDEEIHHPHAEWLEVPTRFTMVRAQSSFAVSRIATLLTLDQSVPVEGSQPFFLDRYVVHPESAKRVLWCFIGGLLLIYDAFTIPMEAANLWSLSTRGLFIFCLVYWLLDIGVHLLTGYVHDSGVEMSARKTMRHYARGWMLVDISIVFLDIFFLAIDSAYGAGAFRLVRLARFTRLIRLRKWSAAFTAFMSANDSAMFNLIVKIVGLLALLLLICHLTACAWFGLADVEDLPTYGVGGNWVDSAEIRGTSQVHSYATALHWSITQFSPATNNIVPVSTVERLFAVQVVLVGMLVFSAFLSNMTSAVNELKSFSAARMRERFRMVAYIKSRSVSQELGRKVMHFFDTISQRSQVLIESDLPMLLQLPESVRICLHAELFLPCLQEMAIVSHTYLSDKFVFLSICHQAMSEHRFMAQQELFMDGMEANSAYVAVAGQLEYTYCPADKECLKRKTLKPMSWLAEGALWLSQWSHRGSLLAHTTGNIVILDCPVMRKTIRSSGSHLLGCLRCFSILYAHSLHLCGASATTDLGLDHEAMDDVCWRALRFCKMESAQDQWQQATPGTSSTFGTSSLLKFRKWTKTSTKSSLGTLGTNSASLGSGSKAPEREVGS